MGLDWGERKLENINIRESGRYVSVGVFEVPQVLTFQVKKELRRRHKMHKRFSLSYQPLFYLEGRSRILKEHQSL